MMRAHVVHIILKAYIKCCTPRIESGMMCMILISTGMRTELLAITLLQIKQDTLDSTDVVWTYIQ